MVQRRRDNPRRNTDRQSRHETCRRSHKPPMRRPASQLSRQGTNAITPALRRVSGRGERPHRVSGILRSVTLRKGTQMFGSEILPCVGQERPVLAYLVGIGLEGMQAVLGAEVVGLTANVFADGLGAPKPTGTSLPQIMPRSSASSCASFYVPRQPPPRHPRAALLPAARGRDRDRPTPDRPTRLQGAHDRIGCTISPKRNRGSQGHSPSKYLMDRHMNWHLHGGEPAAGDARFCKVNPAQAPSSSTSTTSTSSNFKVVRHRTSSTRAPA